MNLKSLLFLALGGALVSLPISADPVSRQKAMQTASAYLKSGNSPQLVKSVVRKNAKAKVEADNAPLYIFSRGAGAGFVIVSGDDCLPEVIGYTDSGDFDEANMPPALLDMIEGYSALIEKAQEAGATARAKERVSASWTSVAPLVSTHWHQTWPYYDLCPMRKDDPNSHCLTGCTCTAAAQVAYYWYKDANAYTQYDTPSYSYGSNMENTSTVKTLKGTPLKWGLMQKSYSSSTPSEMCNAVATLMNVIGISLYQTYGSSTSGQIGDIVNVYNGQIGLSSTCWYKSGNSQSYWEQLCYTELSNGRPIVYAGVHPEQGGHAVVVDGYDSGSGKFHFNFGWGGSGDGYYTVDDETGMNGFASSQGMVFRIMPKKSNLSGTMETPSPLYFKHTNTVTASITNNGTLPYSGFYLFASRSEIKTFNVANAVSSNLDTAIGVDATGNVTFTHKPATAGTWHYYVTDAQGNLLATCDATTEEATSALHFKSIEVNASDETESIGGKNFGVVYNTSSNVSVKLSNEAGADPYEGSPRCELYVSEDGGNTFTYSYYKSCATVIEPGETQTLEFLFSSLDVNKLYYVKLLRPISTANTLDEVTVDTNDTIAYFKLRASDLAIASVDGTCAKLSGSWNSQKFVELAKAQEGITTYDLREVLNVSDVPTLENNPNALFYVADNANATGLNVVKNGACKELSLTYGYDFEPWADFTAEKASYKHVQAPGEWAGTILPFNCTIPNGFWGRKITELRVTYIYACENVTSLKAGTPYLLMSSTFDNNRLTAANVTVTTHAASEVTDSIQGTFVHKSATASNYVVDNETGYFEAATEGSNLPAFSAYLNYMRRVRISSYTYNGTDPTYPLLAKAIDEAYAVLNEYASKRTAAEQETLSAAIGKAETDFTEQTLTSKADINAAIETLNEAVANYVSENGVAAGTDCTGKIINPSFENQREGWTTDNSSTIRSISTLNYYAVGADQSHILFNYVMPDSTSTSLSQTITGLENGYYRLTAMTGTKPGSSVTMFANEKENAAAANPFGQYYLTENVIDSVLVTDGTLTIGIKGGTSWYKVDDFRLTYEGKYVDPSGITSTVNTPDNLTVVGGIGCINLQSDEDVTVCLYTISGQLLAKKSIKAGRSTIGQLAPGLYIVNHKKVVVR